MKPTVEHISMMAAQIYSGNMKPKKILLDQYHIDIYIRPTRKLTTHQRQRIKRLMNTYLTILSRSITKELDNRILVRCTQ